MNFKAVHDICEIKEPLHWTPEKSELMLEALRTMVDFHKAHNASIRWLYQKYNFESQQLKKESDIAKIPALGVTAMKYNLFTSLNPNDSVLRLTSSGTRGQKTQILFDQESLNRVQRMMDVYLEQEGFVSDQLQNYMVFNYNPDQAGDLGTAYTEKNQLRFAPVHRVHYAIQKDENGNWVFDKNLVYDILKSYESEKYPIRIFAMPAFLFEFIEFLESEKKQKFEFSNLSWILTGGGWKAAEDKKVSREQFRELCRKWFAIPEAQQRDAFGMAEHCAPYFQCRSHRFHIPVFNRILIRDPLTYKVLPPGEVGLMELITPFNAMMPTTALLSTDYAMIDPTPCDCGWKSATFSLIGRAGIQKHKGCAISANELVRRK